MSQVTDIPTAKADEAPDETTFVLDLGKKSRKSVKKLRKGRGKLMDRVQDTIEQLRADSELGASADVVIVIVKQKSRPKGLFF
ncbi:MAG TPA: hypothetical protein VNP97_12540 [Microbacterium sp.]|nr:hypothetical protein [Microbacterium sp.]